MKLDEFMEIANSAFEDFQRETTLEQMAGNRDFIGRFMDRDEVDWFREVRGLS